MDSARLNQTAFEVVADDSSGMVWDTPNHDGIGSVVVAERSGADSQFFFVRSKGQLTKNGLLENESSGRCMTVLDGVRLVGGDCQKTRESYFRFYANGEVISMEKGYCVSKDWTDPWSYVRYCENRDTARQLWLSPAGQCQGDYCSLEGKLDGDCLDGGQEHVETTECDGSADQRWKWVGEDDPWTDLEVSWEKVECGSTNFTVSVTNEVNFSGELSDMAEALEIGSAIQRGTVFGSGSQELDTASAYSLSRLWESTYATEDPADFVCDHYASGDVNFGYPGCLWQLRLTGPTASHAKFLSWRPQIVRYVSDVEPPRCPPFKKCFNPTCTLCVEDE